MIQSPTVFGAEPWHHRTCGGWRAVAVAPERPRRPRVAAPGAPAATGLSGPFHTCGLARITPLEGITWS